MAVEVADSFSVLLPEPGEAILAGVKVAVTPLGRPVTDRATVDLKPFCAAVVKVTGMEPPAVTMILVPLGVSVKVGDGTVSAREAVRVNPAPVPVSVKV